MPTPAGSVSSVASTKHDTGMTRTGRQYCVSRLVEKATRGGLGVHYHQTEQVTPPHYERLRQVASHITSFSVTDRTATIEFASLTDADAHRFGVEPGDAIRCGDAHTVMMIHNRVGTTVTARLETN